MCSLFGCNFFVASMPGDVMTRDVCVPSWAAKSVNKSDQAFFEPKVAVHSVLMHIPEHVRECASAQNEQQLSARRMLGHFC